jgi:hypothetical protein
MAKPATMIAYRLAFCICLNMDRCLGRVNDPLVRTETPPGFGGLNAALVLDATAR